MKAQYYWPILINCEQIINRLFVIVVVLSKFNILLNRQQQKRNEVQ